MMVKLLDFWAAWCSPCKIMNPIIEELEKELSGKVKIVKINVDEDGEKASEYGVMSIPTYILEKNGKELDRVTGARSKGEFKRWIGQYLEN